MINNSILFYNQIYIINFFYRVFPNQLVILCYLVTFIKNLKLKNQNEIRKPL